MTIEFFYPIGKEPEKDPVIELLPKEYCSASIIFYPFIKMPDSWVSADAPTNKEIYKSGSPISWREIQRRSNLNSISEVSKAVIAYLTGGLARGIYQRLDLFNKINENIEPNLFFPNEDEYSMLLIDDMLKVLGSKGAKKVLYNKLIEGSGVFELNKLTTEQKLYLCSGPMIIMDEYRDFSFTCYFDQASMVFFTKEDNLDCLKETKFEGVFLEKETPLIWENHQCTYFNYNRT
ncbi:DUF2711 family protein [Mesobacillus jeotgali]|uniref:DUF2711 family protein n=1 Tax=Mesobacillus jeotgali TaxID=129985 RepID=UPI001CFCA167|nr:DUF2711 family protein [Mesobacillus jeotgali]